MVFGFVIAITSAAKWQVKRAEFRKCRFIIGQNAHAHTWYLVPLMFGASLGRRQQQSIRNEWAERVITAVSVLTGRRTNWWPYQQFTCLIDWHNAGIKFSAVLMQYDMWMWRTVYPFNHISGKKNGNFSKYTFYNNQITIPRNPKDPINLMLIWRRLVCFMTGFNLWFI